MKEERVDYRVGGMGHLHGVGESAAVCCQVGPPAEKGKAAWNSFEAHTSQGSLGLWKRDS